MSTDVRIIVASNENLKEAYMSGKFREDLFYRLSTIPIYIRPLRERIFFVAWVDDSFVLLHQFMKKSQKTPLREIEKAKREFADLTERGLSNE